MALPKPAPERETRLSGLTRKIAAKIKAKIQRGLAIGVMCSLPVHMTHCFGSLTPLSGQKWRFLMSRPGFYRGRPGRLSAVIHWNLSRWPSAVLDAPRISQLR